MNNLNSVLVEGNLTKDPELSYTPKGTAVCKFSVGCHRYYKQDEEIQQEVSFFDITVWSRQAEVCSEYLHTEAVATEAWQEHRHTFSHFRLDIEPIHIRIRSEENFISEHGGTIWYRRNAPPNTGLAAPVVKLLQQLYHS